MALKLILHAWGTTSALIKVQRLLRSHYPSWLIMVTAPVPSHQPFARFANAYNSMNVSRAAPVSHRSKPVPASIDTAVTSKSKVTEVATQAHLEKDIPFLPHGPSTPSSLNGSGHAQEQFINLRGPPTPSSMHSNGRSASPATIASGRKSPYRMPPRSATAPLPPRSPSPDLPLPQECAFPVFPTVKSRSTTSMTAKKTTTEQAKTELSRLQLQSNVSVSKSKRESEGPALSPTVQSQDGTNYGSFSLPEVLKVTSRPASPAISHSSGRRPSVSIVDSHRKFSFSSNIPIPDLATPMELMPPLQLQIERENPPQLPPLLMVGPQGKPLGHHLAVAPAPTASAALSIQRTKNPHIRRPSLSATHRPLNEIGSVKAHKPTDSRGRSLAKINTDVNDGLRSVSACGQRTTASVEDAPPVPQPADNRRSGWCLPRSASAIGTFEQRPFDTPPLPQQAQFDHVENDPKPNHMSTESTSSNESHNTFSGTSSSRSSPPTSSITSSPERRFAALERALESIGPTPSQAPTAASTPAEARRRPSAKSFSRPMYATTAPPPAPPPPAAPADSKPPSQPESPMDPDLKGGRLPLLTTDDKHFPSSASRQPQYPQSAVDSTYRGPNSFLDLAPPPLNVQRPPARRASTSHKGNCRGCSELITGKSVSSADGRLTGRWHKQCFVCRTCKEPFPTMDFYVLGNDPYCNRHYHQLNRSLCSNCDRGIEGQYVETEQQKFHPHCFNCRVRSGYPR